MVGLLVYLDLSGKSLSNNDITGLSIMIGFLIVLLLLPSLTKFKVATLEMETIGPVSKNVELEPKAADIPLEQLKKFISRH